ncbi:MAG: hypothetical protein ACYDC3_12650 [Candidatus Binataceae bacterium]
MPRAILRTTISASLIAAVIALCAGCGSAAKDNVAPEIATLQDGATSYSQVMESMGKPYQDWGEPDGSRTVIYMLSAQPSVAGTHSQQTTTQAQTKLTLKFDPSGTLASHASEPVSNRLSPIQ